ncbi:hypothetical protein LCGC14_0383310 [marine sediment metagenome]|uniref:Uncharacterized protein n=1 Tax=marine sediment metagenome TaxID=412755 RepID=A0A0F9TJT8_9ZZZZ
MKIVCAWCDKSMGEKPPLSDTRTTHGICDQCIRDCVMEDGDESRDGDYYKGNQEETQR